MYHSYQRQIVDRNYSYAKASVLFVTMICTSYFSLYVNVRNGSFQIGWDEVSYSIA